MANEMNIEIQKSKPELINDYINFFDKTPHSEITDDDECKCYCVWWCNDDQNDEVFNNFLSSREKRKNYAINSIMNNKIQGYLVYCDNKVVGWCNTNAKADCLKCFCWRNFLKSVPIEKHEFDLKVKSIFCFLIAPEYRRKGLTKLLLEHICREAKEEGFEIVESYPKKEYINVAEGFMGSVELYIKNGFVKCGETEDKFIMRKQLI